MEHIKNLRSVYGFPGCDARATVRSYGDDPAAIVVSLRRRRKKRSALVVGRPTDRITTRDCVTCVTCRVVTGVSSCSCRSGA